MTTSALLHSTTPFLPIKLSPEAGFDLESWLYQNQELVQEQLDHQGAILLRGLNIDSAPRLDDFVSLFPLNNFPYDQSLSNALRLNKTERVFTANEAPAHLDIVLHHEMAQTTFFPDWLFFSCALKAEAGGATPVCRSDLVYQDLLQHRPRFIHQCEEQGFYYRQKFAFESDQTSAQGRSWPHLLELNQALDLPALQTAAQEKLTQLGYRWQWHNRVLEIISPVLPGIRRAKNQQKVFFNQLLAAYTSWNNDLNSGVLSVFYGHGQSIDEHDIKALQDVCQKHTQDIRWEVGDVAILDNHMVMHGRRAYTGKRQVFASLAVDP